MQDEETPYRVGMTYDTKRALIRQFVKDRCPAEKRPLGQRRQRLSLTIEPVREQEFWGVWRRWKEAVRCYANDGEEVTPELVLQRLGVSGIRNWDGILKERALPKTLSLMRQLVATMVDDVRGMHKTSPSEELGLLENDLAALGSWIQQQVNLEVQQGGRG